MKIITPELKLAPDEKQLLMLYRAMQDWPASDLLALAEEYLRLFPRDRPTFRLVVGGAK